MKRVGLHNLGCKVNSYELEVVQQNLQKKGYEIVPFEQIADIYVINTCSVTNIADRKSRQMIHKAKALNPHALVVACGCYVEGHDIDSLKEDGVDILISNKDKTRVVELIDEYLSGELPTDFTSDNILHKPSEHTRAFIKIQDGCNCFCTYCIIPYMRGREISRPLDEILEEVRELGKNGCYEVVLTGIHLSSFEIAGVMSTSPLVDLINEISQIDDIKRIRLGSLEPQIITEDFVKALADNNKFCPHFHLSLQSGCDSVLKRMNRHYSAGDFYERAQLLRKYFDNPALTTDVIVGFPGETEEEFAETVAFLEKIKFYETHIFKYSRRKGTKADRMDGQLTEKEKTARANVLAELNKKNKAAFEKSHIGKEAEILLEEEIIVDGKKVMVGHTREYIKCNIVTEKMAGEIVTITLDDDIIN